MNEEPKGFLSRWSQRKVQVRQGVAPVAADPLLPKAGPATPASLPAAAASTTQPVAEPEPSAGASAAASPAGPQVLAPQATPVPKPTLQDVEALTPESDFTRFMARDVDPQVKNSAMKKLFADPHYNVMDRLDTYIDDYNTPDPIPKAMFKQLVQARMLGLLDDELEDQIPAAEAGLATTSAALESEQPAVDGEQLAATEPVPAAAEVQAPPDAAPAAGPLVSSGDTPEAIAVSQIVPPQPG
jgi:hypothetical protein